MLDLTTYDSATKTGYATTTNQKQERKGSKNSSMDIRREQVGLPTTTSTATPAELVGPLTSIMTKSTKDLDPIIKEFINLITKQEHTIDGCCVTTVGYQVIPVMLVALRQLGFTTFDHLRSFHL